MRMRTERPPAGNVFEITDLKEECHEYVCIFHCEQGRKAGDLCSFYGRGSERFTREENDMLEAYMRREKDRILQMAKSVNVMDAFLNG